MEDALAVEQLKRYEDQRSKRSSIFDPAWQDLSDYFLPSQSDINTTKTEGTIGWTDRIFDTTAIQANQTLAAGQRNWLTPSNEPWFSYEPPEELGLEEGDDAAMWLGKATDRALKELGRSNFYARAHEDYLSIGAFGTGCVFLEEGKSTSLNFRQMKIGTYTIGENDEGIVDEVRREFELTTRQAAQWFGEDNLPPRMQRALKSGKGLDTKWKFVHCVFPREDSKRIKGKLTGDSKPIASVYIAKDEKTCVSVSGYDEMPYLVSRFSKWGTDAPWGYSPAFLCLPDARQLNYVVQYIDALAELKAYPRLLIPENMDGDVDLRAGGQTVFDPTVNNGVPKEWATVGDYQVAIDLINRKADAVNKAFFVNMFTMLEQLSDKKMTAYEIAQRLGEKLEQFTPTFDRRVTEFLNPLLRRVFGILFRQGKFGRPPASLLVPSDDGKSVSLAMPEVVITSRVSLALKALQNQATVNTMQFLMPIAQIKPETMDNFDWDKIVRNFARNSGMSPDDMKKMADVMKVRMARFQMQQAQQKIALAQGAAKAGKDLEKSPDELKNAALGMMGLTGAGAA